ncbi:hypothetical protein [Aromatoleum buckelii]|uniref:Uncharacterized protein n=1 Tax=Aromatoleum buckelii TaxID=200254 RepID=A0ABX1MYP6_9RHOO|nr:hypothetical protein [Aromatoleum buckelii]MCK0510245.1 hypothetical protein [Aromatoleum buckelii]
MPKNTMARKSLSLEQIADALALREAGYTVLAISQRLGIPTRTLERHFAKHGAQKGVLKKEAIEAARAEILQHIMADDTIRAEAAKMIADDLAHARHVRTIILNAAEQLKAASLQEAALVMRAAAAYSTAIKNTSDMVRHSLRPDRGGVESRALPELVIEEITAAELERIRKAPTSSGEPSAVSEDDVLA